MAYEDLTGDVVFNEISKSKLEELEEQNQLTPNQYWLTNEDELDNDSVIGLPLGLILPSAIVQEHPALQLLDGSTFSQTGIYNQFVVFLKQQASEGKVVLYTQSQYDADINTYGQCGHFVVDDTNNTFRLPTITEFIASNNGGKQIGLAELDSFKSHTHSVKNQQETLILAPSGSYNGLLTSKTGFETGATGGDETKPKNIRYPYYIVLANNLKFEEVAVDINSIRNDIADISRDMARLSDIPADAIVAQSLGQKGYIKFKNGIMIQWLNANHSGSATHSWALPFTSATSYCMATSTLGASSSSTANVSIRNQAYSKTNTGFSAYNTAFASSGCDYIAIGY